MFSAQDREALLCAGSARTYSAGDVVISEGDHTTFVVAILEGWAVVSTNTRRGGRLILAVRGAGDVIGDLSAIDGRPRSATVSALNNLRTVTVPGERFRSFLGTHPEAAVVVMGQLGARLRDSDQQRRVLASETVLQRLAKLLVEFAGRGGTRTSHGILIDLRFPQNDLAASIGSTREAVAKALRVLRDRGILHTKPRQILVIHLDLLTALAGE